MLKVNYNFARKFKIEMFSRKITVFENHRKSLNIASKASYFYILSGQKFTKNAKNSQFWRVFDKPETCGQTVLPDRSLLKVQKFVENAKIEKFKCDILREIG